MRLAGGALPGMSFDAFLAQATEYQEEDDLFSRHARFWLELNLTHPFAVRRVRELMAWVKSGDYDRIRQRELRPPRPRATAYGGVHGGRGPLPGALHRFPRADIGRCADAGQAAE